MEIEYIYNVISPLLNDVEKLRIEKTTDEMGVLISIQCTKNDMGKVIGKEGNNAKAIRTLANAFGMKNKQKVSIKILEPEV
jgi:predicted RNA-binding protein YlqC (UPF0109 family)